MPATVIEYKDGTTKEYDFMRGGMYMAAYKAEELLETEGHLAKKIYVLDWERDLDNAVKWED